jgi:hypothetical protein
MKMVSREALLEVCGKVTGARVEVVKSSNGSVELRTESGNRLAKVGRLWKEFDLPVADGILRQVARGNNEVYSSAKRLLRQA